MARRGYARWHDRLDRIRHRHARGGCEPQRRHASARVPAAARVGHRPVPQGRVGASDRIPQAPARAVADPVRAGERAHPRGHDARRGVQRIDRGVRGVLRPHARAVLRHRGAALDQPGEDRPHRVLRRPLPLRRPRRATCTPRPSASPPSAAGTTSTSSPTPSARPTGAATTTSRRACSASCRASGIRSPSWIVVGAGTGGTSATFGRYVRYRRHETRIAVVDPEGSAFYGGWRIRRSVVHDRHPEPDRGHRTPARRAVVRGRCDRRDDPRAGCRVDRRDPAAQAAHAALGGRIHRHEPGRRVPADRADAARRASAAASSP